MPNNLTPLPVNRLPETTRRMAAWFAARQMAVSFYQFTAGTKTAEEAAARLGCQVGQIAKSIVLKGVDGQGVLVVTSGQHRVDLAKVAVLLGFAVKLAPPDFVLAQTGYAVGSVGPVALTQEMVVLFDETLLRYETVYPAAGTSDTLFMITPQRLVSVTGAQIGSIGI